MAKMIASTICIIIFTVLIIVVRPYRCNSSNLFYCIGMIGLSLQCLFCQALVA